MRLKCKNSKKPDSFRQRGKGFFNRKSFIRQPRPDNFFSEAGKAIAKNITFAFVDEGMNCIFIIFIFNDLNI